MDTSPPGPRFHKSRQSRNAATPKQPNQEGFHGPSTQKEGIYPEPKLEFRKWQPYIVSLYLHITYICICIGPSTYMYVCVYIHVHIYTHIYICSYFSYVCVIRVICDITYVYVYTYIYIYIFTHIFACAYTYIHIYTHLYTYRFRFRGTGSKARIQPVMHLIEGFPPEKGGGPPQKQWQCALRAGPMPLARGPTLEQKSAAPVSAHSGKLG